MNTESWEVVLTDTVCCCRELKSYRAHRPVRRAKSRKSANKESKEKDVKLTDVKAAERAGRWQRPVSQSL